MTRRGLALVVLLWVAGVLLHDPVTVLLAGIAERHGFATLQAALGAAWTALGALGLAWVLRRGGAAALLPWAAWAAQVALWWAVCQQTRAEAVHLVQYALPVWLLWPRWGARPTALLAACALAGILDEGVQARVLYPERPFDWNDVVLDVLGGVAGALVRRTPRPDPAPPDAGVAAGFWVTGVSGAPVHFLSPVEGVVLVALLVGGWGRALSRARW